MVACCPGHDRRVLRLARRLATHLHTGLVPLPATGPRTVVAPPLLVAFVAALVDQRFEDVVFDRELAARSSDDQILNDVPLSASPLDGVAGGL